MAKFIELPLIDGKVVCINTDYIEEVRSDGDDTCTVYMAFNVPDAVEQDYYEVNQAYGMVVRHLLSRCG